MGKEAKTAEEEFDILSCPKFVKVGTQREIAEAFADYGAFSIRERKQQISRPSQEEKETEKEEEKVEKVEREEKDEKKEEEKDDKEEPQ
eukprot:g26618.t1